VKKAPGTYVKHLGAGGFWRPQSNRRRLNCPSFQNLSKPFMHPAFRTIDDFTLGETAIDFDTKNPRAESDFAQLHHFFSR
jgi:hypothetical protein